MKKQLLALICAFAFVGNATAGIRMTCDELQDELNKVQKRIMELNMQMYGSAAKEAELRGLQQQALTLTKEMKDQGCPEGAG